MSDWAPRRDFADRRHRGPAPPRFRARWLAPDHWPTWLGLAALSALWLLLPVRARDRLGYWLGDRLASGRWIRRIPDNLRRCFVGLGDAELDALTREHCRAQACVWLDLPALWLAAPERLRERVQVEGLEHLEALNQQGTPVCLLVCHSLGMEHAARALKWSYPMLGYFQPFGNAPVDWLLYRARVRNGGYLLARGASMRALVRDLREGWMLYMMIDEDMGEREGEWADFFAARKCAIRAPAKLAAIAGARAVPVYSWYDLEQRRYRVSVFAPLADFPSGDSAADARRCMAALEAMIGERVAQYGWRQKLFRSADQGRAEGALNPDSADR